MAIQGQQHINASHDFERQNRGKKRAPRQQQVGVLMGCLDVPNRWPSTHDFSKTKQVSRGCNGFTFQQWAAGDVGENGRGEKENAAAAMGSNYLLTSSSAMRVTLGQQEENERGRKRGKTGTAMASSHDPAIGKGRKKKREGRGEGRKRLTPRFSSNGWRRLQQWKQGSSIRSAGAAAWIGRHPWQQLVLVKILPYT